VWQRPPGCEAGAPYRQRSGVWQAGKMACDAKSLRRLCRFHSKARKLCLGWWRQAG